MIINSITLRNFKSYGNNLQKLSFSKEGSLILLTGKNGNGKSSLLESIDFALYNIVRGKNTKRVPLYILPNRTNKNLEAQVDFVNWNNDNVIINRRLNPKGFKISVNGTDKTDRFDIMQPQEKEDIIGIEYNTYKSLVSLNLADFANFINLDTETKRKLLNKLFNLDEIDNYLSIAKELLKNLYKKKDKLDSLILTNQNTINTYNSNVDIILEKSGNISRDDIKKIVSDYKDEFMLLTNDIKEIKNLIYFMGPDIKSKMEVYNSKKNKVYEDEVALNELNKKIEIFQDGNCPFCGTVLTDDDHKKELDNLLDSYEDSKTDILELKKSLNNIKVQLSGKMDEKKNYQNELNDKQLRLDFITGELRNLKSQYKSTESISVNELNKNVENLNNELVKYNITLDKVNRKINKYDKLIDVLSERGIRRGIIKTVVDPINDHLSKYLVELESMYNVRLDDNFDAIIKERFIDDIHVESLSTGEARKINVAIALSYMEMVISMNKRTNILFLDEVFASVDADNIDLMLKVLRGFSNKYNINVIIVNHTLFDVTKFDRVISVGKTNGYSFIKEIEINENGD